MTVLIIDDSDLMRLVLRTYLQRLDITCLEAVNGREALSILDTHTFDLVLLDIDMPVMNGVDFLRAIERERHPFHAKILMITASSPSQIQDALDHGANDFILKPLTKRFFSRRLRH